MMKTDKKAIRDPDLVKVERALLRAAARARKIARDTDTPLVIYKEGRIILQQVEETIPDCKRQDHV